MEDRRGLKMTGSDRKSVEIVDNFCAEFLSGGPNLEPILTASAQDPSCALAHAWAAVLFMFGENKESQPLARPYIDRACNIAGKTLEHEQLFIEAVAGWVDGDETKSLAAFDRLVLCAPNFLAGARLGQIRHIYRGDWLGHLRLVEQVLPANQDDPHALGMLAFALEQCHRFDAAERAAEAGLAILPNEPWTQHALAHVYDSQGRPDAGLRLMAGITDRWADRNPFIKSHNRWHHALFCLDAGNPTAALARYDDELWGIAKDFSAHQVDAVAMLARLELHGVGVGERWRDLGSYLTARVGEHLECFNDIHYAYGLARAGLPAADAFIDSLRAHAATCPAATRWRWEAVCLPTVEGLVAHGRGDWGIARDKLAETREHWLFLGGSHAQRDLLVQIYLDALLRTARWLEASDLLERRWQGRPDVVWPLRRLAEIYDRTGLGASADWARAEAKRRAA